MSSIAAISKKVVRAKPRPKAKPMTKLEMVQKMLGDQKFIREAIQNGVSFKELRKKHGFKFATV
ncbi:MAG: hypothetical protein ABIS01_05845 [Ferruginibacter sp.]